MPQNERFELAVGVNYQAFGDNEDGILLSMESGYLYRCNATAMALLDVIHRRPTSAELQASFTSAFDVAEDKATTDLASFLKMLLDDGLVTKSAA